MQTFLLYKEINLDIKEVKYKRDMHIPGFLSEENKSDKNCRFPF